MNYGFRYKDQLPVCVLLLCLVACVGIRFALINGHPISAKGTAIEFEMVQAREYSFELDVNDATWSQLSLLPGIGERLAKRIIEFRELNGRILDIELLQSVEGIGPKKMEVIRKYLRANSHSFNQPAGSKV